jgi:hypothetical protein
MAVTRSATPRLACEESQKFAATAKRREGRGLDFGARVSERPLVVLEELDLTLLLPFEATNAFRLKVTGRGLLVCFIVN